MIARKEVRQFKTLRICDIENAISNNSMLSTYDIALILSHHTLSYGPYYILTYRTINSDLFLAIFQDENDQQKK